jgi:hypothetical protein
MLENWGIPWRKPYIFARVKPVFHQLKVAASLWNINIFYYSKRPGIYIVKSTTLGIYRSCRGVVLMLTF